MIYVDAHIEIINRKIICDDLNRNVKKNNLGNMFSEQKVFKRSTVTNQYSRFMNASTRQEQANVPLCCERSLEHRNPVWILQ